MSAVERLLSTVEGKPMPQHGTNDATKCDYDSVVINPGDRISVYFATVDYSTGREGHWFLLRVYGECCNRRRVLFPTSDVSEMLIGATLTKEKTIADPEIRDFSPTGDGVPYDPLEAFEKITTMPARLQFNSAGMAVGPEDVVDALMKLGVDIREYVTENGGVTVTDTQREELKEHLEERAVDQVEAAGGMAALEQRQREWREKTAKYAEKFGPEVYEMDSVDDE